MACHRVEFYSQVLHVARSVVGFENPVSDRAFFGFGLVVLVSGLAFGDDFCSVDEVNAFIIKFNHLRIYPLECFINGEKASYDMKNFFALFPVKK